MVLFSFQGKSKNQRNFWDIWGSDSQPATAAGDDLFLEVRRTVDSLDLHAFDEVFIVLGYNIIFVCN